MAAIEPNKAAVLKAVIEDIDQLLTDANKDLRQLNGIARVLKVHKGAGNISALHYTVDQERLQRTINKCKLLLITLLQQRQRAVDLLKE
ncbi:MAG: hypothetical protein QFB87_01490 [Patescibacteria group bacterium]|nr:hypothetical protein [Patescibacteria group bacterium]